MTFGSTFGRVFSPTFQPKSQAAVASGYAVWYTLDGEITPLMAYQAKGVASLAASYVNLISSGTYDLIKKTNDPGWNATDGWQFDTESVKYLSTQFNPDGAQAYSIFVRYSNVGATGGCAVGSAQTTYLGVFPGYASGKTGYGYRSAITQINDASNSAGVAGVATTNAYKDGTDVGDLTATGTTARRLLIGACGTGQGDPSNAVNAFTGYIQAVAIYQSELTATQALNLSTAMAAL